MALLPILNVTSDIGSGYGSVFDVSSGSSAASGKSTKHIKKYRLSEKTMNQIHDVYMTQEPMIRITKDKRNMYTFAGDLRIEWGGGDINPVVLSSPHDRAQLVALFRTALEWRDMFGMVPIHMRRRAKSDKGRMLIVVPPFGTGYFEMEYNMKTFSTQMFYHINTSHQMAATGIKRRVLDVFVWPGCEPAVTNMNTAAGAKFKSKITVLMERITRVRELSKNMLTADWRQANPVLFTQTRPDNRSVAEATEEELLGGVMSTSLNPIEKMRYTRDKNRAIRNEHLVEQANAVELGNQAPNPRQMRQGVDTATGSMVVGTRSLEWDGGHYQIPAGDEMARTIVPQSRNDFTTMEVACEEIICLAMGIPRTFVTGAGSLHIKGETEQLQSTVRATVRADREDINLFYAWAHERMHRGKDDALLTEALVQVDEANVHDKEEKARIAQIRKNIAVISSMPYRTRVVFVERPLPKTVDLPILQAAIAAKAMTQIELVNILRGELDLESIEAGHDLVSVAEATKPAKMETPEMMAPNGSAAAAKPPQPKKRKADGDKGAASQDKGASAGKAQAKQDKAKDTGKGKEKDAADKDDDSKKKKAKRKEKRQRTKQ